jgi:site-specific DNA-methyltransferase (adenine-specific)
MSVRLHEGDCLDILKSIPDNSIHSVVTDPPYHLLAGGKGQGGFMGQQWDGGDIAFRPETWAAVLRVLKPGGYIVAFSSSRTFGRMSVALEDASFITHPMLGWITAQGFPKATRFQQPELEGWRYGLQALKPALEPIYMGQKPLDGTGSQNWDQHGCGGLNIDACRIGTDENRDRPRGSFPHSDDAWGNGRLATTQGSPLGRWPANVLHDGSEQVLAAFPAQSSVTGRRSHQSQNADVEGTNWLMANHKSTEYTDSGSPSRFFYCAKASKADRQGSKHPTIKPVALMRYLVRLVTPKGGIVLDPFAGSGTTGQATVEEGFDAILIEREAEYCDDIRCRLALFLDQQSQVT